jgi:hypothetical protein
LELHSNLHHVGRHERGLEERGTSTPGELLAPASGLAGTEEIPAHVTAVIALNDITTGVGQGGGTNILLA